MLTAYRGAIASVLLVTALLGCGGGGGGGGSPPPPPAPTPPVTTASPASGIYASPQAVTLAADKPATIYYSLNGDAPSIGAANTLSATSPVTLQISSDTTLVQFFAVDAAGTRESVKTQTYVLNGGAATGPGDPQNYFPLTLGNTWTEQTTTSQTGPFGPTTTTFSDTTTISGTRLVNGITALVSTESNPDNTRRPTDEYVLKSSNGVLLLGSNDSTDTLTAALVPYYVAKFPFRTGSSFVQAMKSGFNFGQDLDGDARNETADVSSVVTQKGFESVTVPAGTFPNSLKVETSLTATVTLSSNGSKITVTGVQTQWLAANVGPVKEIVVTSGGNVTETDTHELTSAIIAAPFFGSGSTFATGLTPWFVATGDFDGNGKTDLTVANRGDLNFGTGGSISVLLGNGSGSFVAAPNSAPGLPIAVGDFNGDGKQDLAVANTGNGDVSILLGNGNGTFAPAINITVGTLVSVNSLITADFNGDGRLDLAVGGSSNGAGFVWRLLGNGDGSFGVPASYATQGYTSSMAVGDFNGDGRLDLAGVNSAVDVVVLLGNGTGFDPAVHYPAPDRPAAVAVADFNGDGRLDLAVATNGVVINNTNVSILLGNGAGSFGPATPYVVDSIAGADLVPSIAVGDFNGDGKLDVAVANQYFNSPRTGTLSILLGDGAGAFGKIVYFVPAGSPRSIVAGDFNADGKADLAVANSNGVSVFLNTSP